MPCGKKRLVKNWVKPRELKKIKKSRYECNEASVKEYWKNVAHEMELLYKDDKFWESQREIVCKLLGPVLFPRIVKIFNLSKDVVKYEPPSESVSLAASDIYYIRKRSSMLLSKRQIGSVTGIESLIEEQHVEEEQEKSEQWSDESHPESSSTKQIDSSRKSLLYKDSRGASITRSRNFSRMISSKSFSQRITSAQSVKTKSGKSDMVISDCTAHSFDDMDVHFASINGIKRRYDIYNPHFDMLFCNESETDMIKWKSKYKQKTFEVSASDEFSKKAEIMTKKIAYEFYEWWTNFGTAEFKSEIKRPEDIEDLFQVWFDEHASRSLMLNPVILPCVLKSVANYAKVPKASCPRALKRQIAWDIDAETSPAHTRAFNTTLPKNLRHIPPKNNTEKTWHCVKIPQDLRTMGAVWDEIPHLTSTKAFYKWLMGRPHLSMPPCLQNLDAPGEMKQPFVVPSDYVAREKSSTSDEKGMALPVSEYSFELAAVLSKLMNE